MADFLWVFVAVLVFWVVGASVAAVRQRLRLPTQ
jgi:hypothetical protein